ncbi:MAG: hypothetical protein GAK43_00263 [Stenotrophomonas maltophilia]|nr:MAG: hypothetical protein GAK43_00263 [Stenotrophomonas maltophilia]
MPAADLQFDGLTLRAILDTGSDSPIILPTEYKDRLVLDAPPTLVGYAVSAAGKQPIHAARLKGSVRVGPVAVERPKVYFMDGGRPNVGLPILRQLRVVYEASGRRSWILTEGKALTFGP